MVIISHLLTCSPIPYIASAAAAEASILKHVSARALMQMYFSPLLDWLVHPVDHLIGSFTHSIAWLAGLLYLTPDWLVYPIYHLMIGWDTLPIWFAWFFLSIAWLAGFILSIHWLARFILSVTWLTCLVYPLYHLLDGLWLVGISLVMTWLAGFTVLSLDWLGFQTAMHLPRDWMLCSWFAIWPTLHHSCCW